jgi:hypothetical protein
MRLNICVNFTYISKSNSSGAQYVIPIKLDEERWKYAGLAQENGFGSA